MICLICLMKSKYFFCPAGVPRTPQDVIYFVYLGITTKDKLAYRKINEFSQKYGCLFMKYDYELADKYEKWLSDIYPGSILASLHHPILSVNAKEMLDIMEGRLNPNQLPSVIRSQRAKKLILSSQDVDYRLQFSKRNLPKPRYVKNLSKSDDVTGFAAGWGFFFTIVCYILAMVINS